MAKPILTIGIPNIEHHKLRQEIEDNIQRRFNDYHVLVYSTTKDDIKFECFFEKDFNEVKYEELRQLILDQI